MGYEFVCYYHERKPEGGYATDERKELRRKVGQPYEDVPLEQLGLAVLKQLARRDIWVVDVEIHEYKKTPVSFRETDGGIVLKNKKFSLDQADTLDEAPEEPPPPPPPRHQPARRPTRPVEPSRRFVRLDDDEPVLFRFRQTGQRFSVGKRYAVLGERPGAQVGDSVYRLEDDTGEVVEVGSQFFLPEGLRLSNDDAPEQVESGPRLLFESPVNDNIVDVRALRRR